MGTLGEDAVLVWASEDKGLPVGSTDAMIFEGAFEFNF